MYIPDLFGAYQKGREAAIDANWNDLMRYEAVEKARNQNDADSLQLLRERSKFGGELAMFNHNVANSERANNVAATAQPGILARADMGADAAQMQRAAYMNNRMLYGEALNSNMYQNIQRQLMASDLLAGQTGYLNKDGRAFEMGVNKAKVAYNQSQANAVTASDFPYQAMQQNQRWRETNNNSRLGNRLATEQIQGALANQPAVQRNTAQNLDNANFAAQQFQNDYANTKTLQAENVTNQKRNYLLQLLREYETTQSPSVLAEVQRMQGELGIPAVQATSLIPPTQPQPAVQSGVQPNAQSGVQSGVQSNTQPTVQSGVQSGVQPNAQFGVQSGVQPNAQPTNDLLNSPLMQMSSYVHPLSHMQRVHAAVNNMSDSGISPEVLKDYLITTIAPR